VKKGSQNCSTYPSSLYMAYPPPPQSAVNHMGKYLSPSWHHAELFIMTFATDELYIRPKISHWPYIFFVTSMLFIFVIKRNISIGISSKHLGEHIIFTYCKRTEFFLHVTVSLSYIPHTFICYQKALTLGYCSTWISFLNIWGS